jgi:sugar phosphate isomerase/epimerase
MEFGLSTYLYVEERLSSHILDQILGAGFRRFEIFAARQHFDYHEANHIRDVAEWFVDHDVILSGMHAPLYADFDWGRSGGLALSIADLEKRHRIDSMDEIKRSLEVAEKIPFRYLILHMGLPDEEFDLAKFDAALTSLEHLSIFAKERGVEILLENIPNDLTSPSRLLQFIHYSRMDFKICFDTGHAHMTCGAHEAFEILKDLIVSSHIHDNNREKDDHLLPFDGGIDWTQTVHDYRIAANPFPLVFEVRNYGAGKSRLKRLQEVIGRIEAIQ